MGKSTFGEHLKREREMRGVSLEEISAATRISNRFLAALEAEQWERLPGGVFNRGFVRAVARFLGLDEEQLVAEYALATNDRPEVAVWADRPAPPRRRIWPRVAALLLVGLAGGGWFAYTEYWPWVAAWRSPLPEVPAPAPPTPPATAARSPAPNSSPGKVSRTLELKIDAGRTTTLTVIADGQVVFQGKMNAGEQKRFQARERFEVSARDSTAVLLELNGQTFLLRGAPDEPGTITLTHKDLKRP